VAGGGSVMIEVDVRKDQFMSLMQRNTGFCDVLHSMGELKKGDLVSECGFVFVVDRVVKGDRMDRVWLKKRGRP